MSQAMFRALADELLTLTGVARSSPAYDNVNLSVDGVTFSLERNEKAGESLVMYCDFGAPPKERKAEVVKALLAANFGALNSAGRESFCMNPLSGHILASSVLPMQNASAKLLLEILRHYAAQAKKWQESYLLRAASQTTACA